MDEASNPEFRLQRKFSEVIAKCRALSPNDPRMDEFEAEMCFGGATLEARIERYASLMMLFHELNYANITLNAGKDAIKSQDIFGRLISRMDNLCDRVKHLDSQSVVEPPSQICQESEWFLMAHEDVLSSQETLVNRLIRGFFSEAVIVDKEEEGRVLKVNTQKLQALKRILSQTTSEDPDMHTF